jgi:hypothetical protein
MVYNIQNRWVYGPIVRSSKELENTTFRELDLFPSSGEGREAPVLLGPLERDNLNCFLVI